ncbi:MAG: deoxyribodipyrimidine photo-lyase [Bernardetiaceae bacterium]|nr:deoxyribodipyrimidine photo-lyase [Bernardetiaceae bacterium]
MSKVKITIFWHRRDLRLEDNHGLFQALKSEYPVLPLFIFDTEILEELQAKDDARVSFIHRELEALQKHLQSLGASMLIKYGKPFEVWKEVIAQYDVAAVFTNHDYEPYAKKRDLQISELLQSHHIAFHTYKDHCIFEKNEVLKKDGAPYSVFTPYSRVWKKNLQQQPIQIFDSEALQNNFFKTPPLESISLQQMGFRPNQNIDIPKRKVQDTILKEYTEKRDYPGKAATSRLGVHLRFGTISIRELAKKAMSINETFLNELIWRDFYMMILYHNPQVVTAPFKPAYANIKWRNDETQLEAWKEGKTGYPIVDAGMRELNQTGYMHNRVRMIVASFLTKHLLIDWKIGEAYFAEKLLDFELASNNGGWQWAASCGCDAVPYFRIFNPEAQLKKFDPNLRYVRQWIPEYDEKAYPKPIVVHKDARARALDTFKEALT